MCLKYCWFSTKINETHSLFTCIFINCSLETIKTKKPKLFRFIRGEIRRTKALSQDTKAEMDDVTALLDLQPPIKQQHGAQQLSQFSYRNKCTIREARKLAIGTVLAAKHLSIQLIAPEQQFHGKSATKLVLVDTQRHQKTEFSRSAKIHPAKHRTTSQGTNQCNRLQNISQWKTTASEWRVKSESKQLFNYLYVCFIAASPFLWHSFMYGSTTRLTCCITAIHSAWQTRALAHF